MAECPYARCVQERRAIKKELQRWTKNIVFLVGLERVAEELMGRRKWKKYQELVYNVPLKAGEETQTLESATEIKDWEPEDRCCFCDGGVFLDSTTPHSESSQSSRDTPPLPDTISAAFPHLPISLRHPQTDSAAPGEGGEGTTLGPLTPPISQTNLERSPFSLPYHHHHRHRRSHSERTPNASLVVPPRIPASPSAMATLEAASSMAASLVTEAASMSSRPGVSPSTTSTASAVATAASLAPQFFPPSAGMFPWYLPPQHGSAIVSHLQSQRHGQTPPTHSEEDRGSSVESSSSDVEEEVGRRVPSVSFSTVLPSGGVPVNPLPPPPRTSSASPSPTITLSSCLSLEQPLDLSARASRPSEMQMEPMMGPVPPSALRVPNMDNKHIFKAKPRMSALGGRRTYTEEELQAALRDIQSGKLGTRRAAVIYGIPRSTLRNKVCAPSDLRVYKLAMERERNHTGGLGGPGSRGGRVMPGPRGGYFSAAAAAAALTHNPPVGVELRGSRGIEEEEEEESEVVLVPPGRIKGEAAEGQEDTNEDESLRRVVEGDESEGRKVSLSMDDLVRFSGLDGLATTDSLRQLLQGGPGNRGSVGGGNNPFEVFPSADLLDKAALAPYIATMFAGGGVFGGEGSNRQEGAPSPGLEALKKRSGLRPPAHLPELMRRMAEDRDGGGRVNGYHREGLEGGGSSGGEVCGPEREEGEIQTAGKNAEGMEGEGQKEEEGNREASVTSPAPNVILKIPSYKPTKNGVAGEESSQSLASGGGPTCAEVVSESSSPSPSPVAGVGGLRALLPRELMARATNQRFGLVDPVVSNVEKRVSNLFSADAKRGRFVGDFGSGQSVACETSKANAAKSTASTTTTACTTGSTVTTGGKGTRPKRGKYRNYDRDSLVEAVRAVQRGEMSVHRAGSYYGVPHSTLEYKVKERHLMRPRKREPKGQQHSLLGKPHQVSHSNYSSTEMGDRKSCAGMDKISKPSLTSAMPHVKSKVPQTFGSPHCAPPLSLIPPNGGLKLRSPYEGNPSALPASPSPSSSSPSSVTYPSAAPHPGGAAFPFWPPAAAAAFHPHLPIELSREQIFASAMMQMLQADANGGASVAAAMAGRPGAPSSTGVGGSVGNGTNSVAAAAAGSFLDGLIRSRLEMGIPGSEGIGGGAGIGGGGPSLIGGGRMAPEGMSNVTLLDQLCRNSRLGTLSRSPPQSPLPSAPQQQATEAVVDLSRVPPDEEEEVKGQKDDDDDDDDVVVEPIKVKVEEKNILTDDRHNVEELSDSKCSLKSACDKKDGSAAKDDDDDEDCVSCPVTENADHSVVDLDAGDAEVMGDVQNSCELSEGNSEIPVGGTLQSEEKKSERSLEVSDEEIKESASPLPEVREEIENEENTKSNVD